MTKQQYRQIMAHYNNRQGRIDKGRDDALEEYVKTNAEHPIGTKLQIDDYGTKKDVQIQKYKVDDNFNLEPVYVSLKGKCVFTHKPTIIKVID